LEKLREEKKEMKYIENQAATLSMQVAAMSSDCKRNSGS